jgi:hypothetical protein
MCECRLLYTCTQTIPPSPMHRPYAQKNEASYVLTIPVPSSRPSPFACLAPASEELEHGGNKQPYPLRTYHAPYREGLARESSGENIKMGQILAGSQARQARQANGQQGRQAARQPGKQRQIRGKMRSRCKCTGQAGMMAPLCTFA